MILETKRLILRPWDEADAESLLPKEEWRKMQ